MAHQSLYRKYRPQSFEDVVGQSHVTRTLRNAVAEGTVAHAYLFTGPRGTGKTTTARILAKALQCEKGPTPEPDGTCEQCVDVTEGRHPDVYELDAASRTQVDIVREEIIGRLAYAPTRGHWKVYIIDEVHMLSTHAFNALLKSIEEPPSHTVFILCTTHPHKVPETIHSRCQRFDFHRIGMEDIVERLALIAEREHMTVAEGTLALVAKHAGGGMRDAISTLEQLAAFTGGDISLDDVEGLLGEVDSALLFELADLVAARDVAAAFRFVARLSSSGVDIPEFVREFVGHVRNLYVVSAVGDPTGIIDMTSADAARLTGQAVTFGPDRLSRVLDVLGELVGELRWSPDPRLALEVALTRLARPQGEVTLEALAERIAALETGVSLTPPPAPAAVTQTPECRPEPPAPVPVPEPVAAPEPAPAPPVVEPTVMTGGLDRARAKRAWPGVIAEVRKLKPPRAAIFDGTEVDVDGDGETLVVEFPADAGFKMRQASDGENTQLLRRSLATVLGGAPPFRFQLGRGPVRAPAQELTGAPPVPVDTPPADGGDEPAPAAALEQVEPSETQVPTPETDDIERMLIDQLGAQVIGEHPNDPDGKD
ncbi:MAG: DNA polymerase III subunit gamma/tau [Anaerosomatales bacterium]|nr:DNA polymerase III subunit gamma/tau [Anaerosomatales bacterium]MDT8433871.1 DNA polymerase III subunit gamma/tau [Anaerosomatales bacterium]